MIKIYVADLASYNSGFLVGSWIELPMDSDDLQDKLDSILKEGETVDKKNKIYTGHHEEYAIHDFETDIPNLEIGEYSNISDLNELAERTESLSDWELDNLNAIMEATTNNLEDALNTLESGDYQVYSDVNNEYDLGWEIAHECGYIDDKDDSVLARYFDYAAFGRDLTFDGYTLVSGSKAIYVY